MPSSALAAESSGVSGGLAPAYRRVPVIDALAIDDARLALLVQQGEAATRVVILDGIAPTIWAVTAEPATLAMMVAAAVARHGEPPDADAATLVAASVARLTDEGLLAVAAR